MNAFKSKVLKVSKGPKNNPCYITFFDKKLCDSLNVDDRLPIIVESCNQTFVTLIRKMSQNKRGWFRLGFVIPPKIGESLQSRTVEFKILDNAVERDVTERRGFINLQKIIPDKTIRGYPIYIFKKGEAVLFWVFARGNKTYTLPKFVPIKKGNSSLFELVGFFFCEGLKARKMNRHRDRLSFSNSEASEISWLINTAEDLFEIDKNEWNAQILYPKADCKSVSSIKKYWSKVSICGDKISVVKNQKIAADYGVCILNIYSVTLAEVFHHLFEHCKTLALQSKEAAIEFFKGVSRGDIGISRKNGKIEAINFSTEKCEDVEFFITLCKKIGLSTSKPYYIKGKKGYWSVFITGYENYKKIIENNAITHTKRKKQFLSSFLNSNKSILYKYLKSVSLGFNTSGKAADRLSLSEITTRYTFGKLRKQGYLVGKETQPFGEIVNSLTNKGEEILNYYQNIENKIEV